jgi:hypothetical protein
MPAVDLAAFRATPLTRQPFDYLVLPRFVPPEACAAINAGYPQINQPGSFPVGSLTYGPAFREFVSILTGHEARRAFEEKFQVDLTNRPTMVTVRGRCGPKDGSIHTDAVTKLITVLIYMNPHWEQTGGRLRLLRSAKDLEDTLVEVPPEEGTLIAFRRSDNSYHGHKPFTGPRRVIQLNWVTDRWTVQREILRHRVSAWMKRVLGRRRKVAPSPW